MGWCVMKAFHDDTTALLRSGFKRSLDLQSDLGIALKVSFTGTGRSQVRSHAGFAAAFNPGHRLVAQVRIVYPTSSHLISSRLTSFHFGTENDDVGRSHGQLGRFMARYPVRRTCGPVTVEMKWSEFG